MASSKAKLSLFWLARNKPWWLVLFAGVLLAASFPPLPLNFLIFVAFVPIFVLMEAGVIPEKVPEDKIFKPIKTFIIVWWRILSLQIIWNKKRRGLKAFRYQRKLISGNAQLFRYTYSIFFIWNLLCCYWLMLTALSATSFPVAVVNTVAGIIAIVLNPLLMTIPLQFHSRIRNFLPTGFAAASLIVFWLCFEYLHLNWDLSWSWLTLGHALSFQPAWIQYAELTGVLGISAHILVANLLIYFFYRNLRKPGKARIISGLAAALWLGLPFLLGAALTSPDRPAFQRHGSIQVRIIQPNIDPYKKDNYYTAEEQVSLFQRLILSKPLDSNTIVMLPEKAITKALDPAAMIRSRLMKPLWALVDSFKIEILTGLDEFESYPDSVEPSVSSRLGYRMVNGHREAVYSDYYNSAIIMGIDRSTKVYRKGKLVPMVERVPFLSTLKALKFLNLDPSKTMASYGRPDSLDLLYTQAGIPINVMICYETVFGNHTRKKTLMGGEWMAVITNDGWWQKSSGYVQHAGLSSIRAIENRRALARCANNGRSMFIDVYGNTSQETNWWEEAVIDAEVPLYQYKTFYVRHGDYIGKIALWLTVLLILLGTVLHYRNKPRKQKVEDSDFQQAEKNEEEE